MMESDPLRPVLREWEAPEPPGIRRGRGCGRPPRSGASRLRRRCAGPSARLVPPRPLGFQLADAVIQLERRDGAFVMSVAQFGDTLATQELTGVTLPDTVYVGLFVSAHNDSVMERATFRNR